MNNSRLMDVANLTHANVLAWGEAALQVSLSSWSVADALLARRNRDFHQLECLLARVLHEDKSADMIEWSKCRLADIFAQNAMIQSHLSKLHQNLQETLAASNVQKKIARFATGDRDQLFKRSV